MILLKVCRVFKRLFEARNPKGQAIITEIDGSCRLKKFVKLKIVREIEVQGEAEAKVLMQFLTARLE